MDAEKKAIYQAEAVFLKSHQKIKLSLEVCLGLARTLTPIDILILPGKRPMASITKKGRIIRLPAWARNPLILCHELAHHVADDFSHGKKFRMAYIRLVKNCLGWSKGNELSKSIRKELEAK